MALGVIGALALSSAEVAVGQNRPTDPGHQDPYAVPEHSPPLCTESVCVHWVESTSDAPDLSDSDGDGVPTYVEDAAAAFELSRFRQHAAVPAGLEWRLPKGDGSRGTGTDLVDLYIKDQGSSLGTIGIDTEACASDGCPAYAVINTNLSEDHLKEITAHEYNHVLHFTYDRFASHPLRETTATWMSARVHPDVSTWVRFVPRWDADAGVPILSSYPYGAAVWQMWLDRRYGPSIIRAIWEGAPEDEASSARTREAYDAAIKAFGGIGLEDELTRFAAALPEWRLQTSGFPHSPTFPDLDRVATLAPNGQPVRMTLRGGAFALVDVAPTAATSLRLDAQVPDTFAAMALVGRDSDPVSGTAVTAFRSLPGGGAGEVVLHDAARFERITAVLVNARDGPPREATATLTPTFAPANAGRPADRMRPRVRLRVRRRIPLRDLVRRGLGFSVRASEPGKLTAVLKIGGNEVRRMKLTGQRRTTIGRLRRGLRAPMARLVVRPRKSLRRRLARLERVRLSLHVSLADAAGNIGRARAQSFAVSPRRR